MADRTCDYGAEVQRSSAQSQPKRKELIFDEVQTGKPQKRKELIFGEIQTGKPQKRKELIFEKYRWQNPKKSRS